MPTHMTEHAERAKSLFETRLTDAYRLQRASDEAAVRDVAEQVVEFLRHAKAALSPILGTKSSTALYQRSLYLTSSEHPWLAAACGEWGFTDPFLILEKAVLRQTLRSAQAAIQTLLHKFRSLLDHLIGVSLTTYLLYPAEGFQHRAVNGESIGRTPLAYSALSAQDCISLPPCTAYIQSCA
jgi:hypothetical protein